MAVSTILHDIAQGWFPYGVRWDQANDTFQAGIVRHGRWYPYDYSVYHIHKHMRRCVLAHTTGVLQYYLDKTDSTKKADGTAADLTGADGQVMVQVPNFQYLIFHDGDYRYFVIGPRKFGVQDSSGTVHASSLHPWFMEGGTRSAYKYYSAFEGVLKRSGSYTDGTGSQTGTTGDLIHSVYGYIPLTYFNLAERRTYTEDGVFHQMGYWADEAIKLLMITWMKSFDSQTLLPGYTEGGAWDFAKVCKTGITASLGNACGSVLWENAPAALRCSTDQTGLYVANSFFGIENVFGHLWKWVDGINIQYIDDGGDPAALTDAEVYVCNNPDDWADDTSTGYEDLGIDLPLVSGYQSDLHDGTLLPSAAGEAGSGSGAYLRDYFYASSDAGWRALLSGGRLTYGAAAGFAERYADIPTAVRHANYGGRSAA